MINTINRMPTAKRGGRKLRNDFILIAAILLLIVVFGGCLYFFTENGDTVTVTVNGELYAEFSLNENITYDIFTGKDSNNINRLVINDGQAYVEYATCPDGICAAHRPISRFGESIVCLPHKVVITTNATNGNFAPDIGA